MLTFRVHTLRVASVLTFHGARIVDLDSDIIEKWIHWPRIKEKSACDKRKHRNFSHELCMSTPDDVNLESAFSEDGMEVYEPEGQGMGAALSCNEENFAEVSLRPPATGTTS